jgi:hypothetical protein
MIYLLYLHIGECFNSDNEPEECSSGQCVAKVSSIENAEPPVSQFCADNDETELVGLYFTLYFDVNFENINLALVLYCEYDKCNNETVVDQLVKIFDEEYDKESVLEMFGYKSEGGGEEPETTNSPTKSSISSSSQQTTNSIKSTTVANSDQSTTVTGPVHSTSVTNPVQLTTVTNSVKSTMVTGPVQTTSVTNPVQSATVTNSVQSTTATNPNNDTLTTKTTKTNNGLHIQSTNAIIYVALIAFMSRFIFLA